MTIHADLYKSSPGAIVVFFVLDATALGDTVYRFHSGVNELGNDVVWQGNTYVRFPVVATGFEWSSQGQLPRPRLQVANVTQLISVLNHMTQDLVGAKLTRKRTLIKYLDAVNFASGNPMADPTAAFADDIWYIERKTLENKLACEYELVSAFDLAGLKLPRRQVIRNMCTWQYRSTECGYTGGPVAKIDDTATSNPALDRCGKRLTSCKLRWGTYAELPFGGFPGVDLVRA